MELIKKILPLITLLFFSCASTEMETALSPEALAQLEKVRLYEEAGNWAAAAETADLLWQKSEGRNRLQDRKAARASLDSLASDMTFYPGDEWVPGISTEAQEMPLEALLHGYAPPPVVILATDNGRFLVRDFPVQFALPDYPHIPAVSVRTDEKGRAAGIPVFSPGEISSAQTLVVTATAGFGMNSVVRNFSYIPLRDALLVAWRAVLPEGEVLSVTPSADFGTFPEALTASLPGELASPDYYEIGENSPRDEGLKQFRLSLIRSENGFPRFLVMPEIVIDQPRQLEFQGKPYNLFTVSGRIQWSCYDMKEDSLLFQEEFAASGQGASSSLAVADCWFRLTRRSGSE